MSLPGDIGKSVEGAGSQTAEAADQLVDAIVAAAEQGGKAAGDVDEAPIDVVVWIVDTATTLAMEAADATQAANSDQAASATKATEVAECARTWAIVGMLVVIVVIAIISAIAQYASGTTSLLLRVITVVGRIVAINTAGTQAGAIVQAAIVAAIGSIPTLVNGAVSPEERRRARYDAIESLRRAISVVQNAARQRLPADKVDLDKSMAAAKQADRALQKLIALLRQRQTSPRTTLIAARLARLEQACAAIVARLQVARPIVSSKA